MSNVLKTCVVVVTLNIVSATSAEVVLDGTLGFKGVLQGPHFAIEAHLGTQKGNNLFHSFETFNLNHHETATFSGSSTINNVISRVTGGEISHIDGTLISAMPHADFYLLNPAGVIFGQNARLDVQGSLYVSTANYLRLGNVGRFDVSHPTQSLLTVAPPTAFGFLGTPPVSISNEGGVLNLKKGNTFSFIGGDLNFQNGQMTVPDGQINLVSVTSPGEVPISIDDMGVFEKWGTIKITDTTAGLDNKNRWIANVDTSGAGGGKVFIQGGRMRLDNGYVFADTLGQENGQGVTIKATEAIVLTNGGRITADVVDKQNKFNGKTGNAGNITVMAKRIIMDEGSQIVSVSQSVGTAGNITLSAEKSIEISGHFSETIGSGTLSSGILTSTLNTGKGGNVSISAPSLNMIGGVIRADTMGFSHAGDVSITVDTLTLSNGAQINVNTGNWNQAATFGTGHGGNLTITARKNVLISGHDGKNKPSGLLSNVFTAGKGGAINISAPLVEIRDNGTIQAGTQSKGEAGHISLNTNSLHIHQGGFITSESKAAGDAGTIHITTEDLTLHHGAMTTQADKSGGGNISVHSKGLFDVVNSTISARAQGTQSYHQGGNLTIDNPQFLILEKSQLLANAYAGNGGNIRIIAEQFIRSSDSILDASSELGIDGDITIRAPENDIESGLTVLPTLFLTALLKKQCTVRGDELISFVEQGRGGVPQSPENLLTHTLLPWTLGKVPQTMTAASSYRINAIQLKTLEYKASALSDCFKN
jgi:filamentous hemagglutinin family protein